MAKRKRSPERPLLALRHGSFASSRAIEGLLAEIRRSGLPEAISRRSHFRQGESAINELQTPYGQVLRDMQVGPHVIPVEARLPMLHTACQMCAPFGDRMLEMLSKHPCSPSRPWGTIFILRRDLTTKPSSRRSRPKESASHLLDTSRTRCCCLLYRAIVVHLGGHQVHNCTVTPRWHDNCAVSPTSFSVTLATVCAPVELS